MENPSQPKRCRLVQAHGWALKPELPTVAVMLWRKSSLLRAKQSPYPFKGLQKGWWSPHVPQPWKCPGWAGVCKGLQSELNTVSTGDVAEAEQPRKCSCGRGGVPPCHHWSSWRLHHTDMVLLVPGFATRWFFTPSYAAYIPGLAREEAGREGGGKANTAPPLCLGVPCGSHAPAAAAFLRDGDSSGKGIQLPNPLIPPETRISGVSSFGSGAWPAGVPVACLRESRTAQISPIGQFLFHALSPAKDNHTPIR